MLDLSNCAIEKTKKARTIAVDFDGTLCKNRYPAIGDPNMRLIQSLIQNRKDGDKVVLFTSREGHLLSAAVEFCRRHGLEFDAVFGGKVIANIYIDDKAVKPFW